MIWTRRWCSVQWFLPFTSRHPLVMTFTHLDWSCYFYDKFNIFMYGGRGYEVNSYCSIDVNLMRKKCLHTTSEIKFACIITNTDAAQEEVWYVTLKVSQLVYIHVAYILTGNFSDTMQLNASWNPPPFVCGWYMYINLMCVCPCIVAYA